MVIVSAAVEADCCSVGNKGFHSTTGSPCVNKECVICFFWILHAATQRVQNQSVFLADVFTPK